MVNIIFYASNQQASRKYEWNSLIQLGIFKLSNH